MAVASTSREAYRKLFYDDEKLGAKQKAVFNCLLRRQYATNLEISQALNWPINTVTGRMTELKEKGLVTVEKTDRCPISGNTAKHWKVHDFIKEHKVKAAFDNQPKPAKVASTQEQLV